jgi:dUTP pyrophosphatase
MNSPVHNHTVNTPHFHGLGDPGQSHGPWEPSPPVLKLRRVHPDAQLPAYGTDGAAAFDFACVDGPWNDPSDPGLCRLVGGHAYLFATGWEVEIPQGYVLKLFSRSGHGFKHGLRLSNCVGIIDSDYRGQLMVQLQADLRGTVAHVRKGDRIVQGILERVERAAFLEVEQLSDTARGAGGFGSTGH